MAIPSGVTTRVVRGTYVSASGTAQQGTVTFRVDQPLLATVESWGVAPSPEVVSLDSNGSFSTSLMASDDTGLFPSGFQYIVQERFQGGYVRTYRIDLPPGDALDLPEASQYDPGDVGLAVVHSVNGLTGIVRLSAQDYGGLPTTGGTLTGPLTLAGDPTTALQATTKQYTDTKLAKSQNLADLPNVAAAKFNLGLSAVNNTSDLGKPVSAATQTALDAKLTRAQNLLDLTNIPLARNNLGLGNVDNTADSTKPISTATQTALDTKLAKAQNLAELTNPGTARINLGLGNVNNTTDLNKPVSTATQAALDTKLTKSQNLSDLTSPATARTNLGLGDSAVLNVGNIASTVAAGDDVRFMDQRTPLDNSVTSAKIVDGTIVNGDISASAAIALSKLAVDPLARANHTGTQLASTISDLSTSVASTAALKANNLSDLTNIPTARTNLGLGGSAVLDVGVITGTVTAGDDARLSDQRTPLDNSVTNQKIVNGTLSLAKLDTDPLARANHTGTQSYTTITGLGTAATRDVGTSAIQVILGNDSRLTDARPPTAHASTHATGGADPITPTAIGAQIDLGIINVATHGAVGNGTTDDTTAIQAALNACLPGGIVYAPKTYAISVPLRIPPQVTFRGAHGGHIDDLTFPTLKPLASFSGTAFILLVDQATGGYSIPSTEQRIEHISIDGVNVPGTTVNAIEAQGYVHGVYITDVSAKRIPNRGLYVSSNGSGTPYSWHVMRFHVNAPKGNGINASMTDSTWVDCEVLGAGAHGWFISGAANSSFVACRSEWSLFNGFEIGGSTGTGQGSGGFIFDSCSTDRNGQHGFNISATGNGPIMISDALCRRDGRSSTSSNYSSINVASATAPVLITGLTVYPGVNDDGSGNVSPQHGLSATGSAMVAYSSSIIHTASTPIFNGGGNTQFLRGANVIERVGPTNAPVDTLKGLIVNEDGQVTVQTPNASAKGVVIKAAASPSANVQEWSDNTGLAKAYFNNFFQFFTTQDIRAGASMQLGSISQQFGGGVGVLGLSNATTVPTTNPASGLVLYSEGNVLKGRTVSGRTPALTFPNIWYAYDFGYRADNTPASAAANTAAIQAAITLATANGAGTVFLPPGTGYITGGIELQSRIWLVGAGHFATVLTLANASNKHMIINHQSVDAVESNGMLCGVRDLCLYGNGVNQTGQWDGIHFDTNPQGTAATNDLYGDASHRIYNVYTRNMSGTGIYSNGRSDSVIVGCNTFLSGKHGFEVRYDTHLIGCTANQPSQTGFYIFGSSTKLTNCKAFNCGKDGSSLNGQTAVPDSGHGFHFTGALSGMSAGECQAQNVTGAGFKLTGIVEASLQGCMADSFSESNATNWAGFVFDNSSRVVADLQSQTTGGVTNGLQLINGSDKNDIRISHRPFSGATTDPLTSNSVLLSNRVHANGVEVSIPGRATPAKQGLVAWSGDPLLVTGSLAPTSGVLTLVRITAARMTFTNVIVGVGTGGTTLTAGQNLVGLYDAAGTLLAQTADQTTPWATTGLKTAAFTAAQAVTVGDDYFIGILSNGATPAAFNRFPSSSFGGTVNVGLTGATLRFATYQTGLTALPGTVTLGSAAASGNVYWVGVS